jgi:hypothetical protein
MEAVVDKASWRELKARAKKAQAKAQKALDAGPNAPNQEHLNKRVSRAAQVAGARKAQSQTKRSAAAREASIKAAERKAQMKKELKTESDSNVYHRMGRLLLGEGETAWDRHVQEKFKKNRKKARKATPEQIRKEFNKVEPGLALPGKKSKPQKSVDRIAQKRMHK